MKSSKEDQNTIMYIPFGCEVSILAEVSRTVDEHLYAMLQGFYEPL